jgi:serine/threonine-protein kinase RsbW
MSQETTSAKGIVELRVPADPAYLAVLRTTTAVLAARLDFTLDEIEDLRIAIDEAGAVLLSHADRSGTVLCRLHIDGDTLVAEVSAQTIDGFAPARDTFAWTVLSALADDVQATASDDRTVAIVLRKRRGGSGAA